MKNTYNHSCSFKDPTDLSQEIKKLLTVPQKFKHIEHSLDSKYDDCAEFIYVFSQENKHLYLN